MHTPGPWFFYQTNTEDVAVCCDKGKHADRAIAYVEADLKEGNALANAHLIAAAPDLLEALKHLQAVVRDEYHLLDVKKRASLCIADAQAGAAIAKAEGRS